MNWTLEVVVVPVSDVERAKTFYADQVGFHVDFDSDMGNVRLVQLTPPGSGCSIVISQGMNRMEPGSLKGVQLVVNDLRAAHTWLVAHDVECSPVQVYGSDGTLRPALPDDDLNNNGFVFFDDPDGNSWAVQQITARP